MDNSDNQEQRHHDEVVASMRHYYMFFRKTVVKRMEHHHAQLTPSQLTLMPGGKEGIKTKIAGYDAALRVNQLFFDKVLLNMGEAPSALTTNFNPEDINRPAIPLGSWQIPHHHANKLSGTLHAVSRDWAEDGKLEREESYQPLLTSLKEKLPIGSSVLVPGSGLARLACEISAAGFKSQGNDFDLFMLFTANYLLNGLQSNHGVYIQPWVHSLCNNLSHNDSLRQIPLPDISAVEILNSSSKEEKEARDMSMCAGEFILAYNDCPEEWNGFVSCFFIDTAPNILEYIDMVYKLLAPGGVWINIGPLMYHWADQFSELAANTNHLDERYHQSLELSWEEVKHAMTAMGFVFEAEDTDLPCHYTLNDRSLMRTQYRCLFFCARKPGLET
eukprot:CAMPEP_0114404158 /NCGR_PEP_ID=MMETSP0102-20121206/19379_1 /TAXON_ID=38822 ORGANISM="Pteridomonas danica, Strain PT" /NCGR_SAMPLE_ID=MMETSP0102 /ASSEMBLY_ACC=CAM_ASM_000212 /LENGTH=387 /DNA_ID=CAMNT_0001568779 /DNA_START=1627 /DNA_END=2787 /DNA_ORIENTATION=-